MLRGLLYGAWHARGGLYGVGDQVGAHLDAARAVAVVRGRVAAVVRHPLLVVQLDTNLTHLVDVHDVGVQRRHDDHQAAKHGARQQERKAERLHGGSHSRIAMVVARRWHIVGLRVEFPNGVWRAESCHWN